MLAAHEKQGDRMSGFTQLLKVSRFFHGDRWYFILVEEWSSKRDKLKLQLLDVPVLTKTYLDRPKRPDEVEPRITVRNQVPEIRLSNACEAVTNLVYSMAEVAAQFANQ
jgi:hypothetical protein